MLLDGVARLGDEPAVCVGGRRLTYAELRASAAALAARWAGAERVAVWAEPALETIVAATAAVESGVTLVPVNPKLGRAELEHVLTDSRPDVIAGAGEAELPGEHRPERVEVDVEQRACAPLRCSSGPEDPVMIVYTSGTTGRPKGAILPRRALASNLDALFDAWDWTRTDVLVHGLPLFHVHGLGIGVLGPLRRGCELRHLGRFDPASAAATLSDGGTMLFGVPTMYSRLARDAETNPRIATGLRAARILVSGSAPLPTPVFDRIRELSGQEIVERYGLTETLMNTAMRADSERRPGYVGRTLPGVEMRLLGEDGSDIAGSDDETIGEILVRGPNLFTGYLNRPDATEEAMREGWFHTGDIATRATGGVWRIVGRRSTDLIKTGGYKVGAGEIEVALLEHDAVAEAAVTAAPDDDLGERIVAWVVAEDGASPGADELIDHVAAELAPHKRPREVVFLDELPRNAMGKVVKARLNR
ncbi:AMP-binding protein [Thermoleophilia bacterium SCSIO 60948]|nr:AMP-binding protein [Thermoleophilia bacterium SCSIO 60948]